LRPFEAFSTNAVELLWKFGVLGKGKWKVKWKSEKWKIYLWYHYIKKARSCEQAF
jgi:hypothetical protein